MSVDNYIVSLGQSETCINPEGNVMKGKGFSQKSSGCGKSSKEINLMREIEGEGVIISNYVP